MVSEAKAGAPGRGSGAAAFWWRLTDNLFRRFVWYLLPILALTAVGFAQARNTVSQYQSTAKLSASSNPLVPDQEIAGVVPRYFESAAQATSRIINERLLTDTFLLSVADEAGLSRAIEAGFLDLEILRANVWAAASGDSILSIRAQWTDPQTSYQLTAATINAYREFLAVTVASDAVEAEAFYSSQLEELVEQREAARRTLDEYTGQLPPLESGEEFPIQVQLEIERLGERLKVAEANIDETQGKIEAARLARTQQEAAAGQSFTVIDQPRVPTAPESTLTTQVTLVASFFMLGLVIAAAALLLVTVIDRTVASPADLLAIVGVAQVATVPSLRLAPASDASLSIRRRRRRSRFRSSGTDS